MSYKTCDLERELGEISLDGRHVYCKSDKFTLYLTFGFVAGAYRHVAVLLHGGALVAGIASLNDFLIFWGQKDLSDDGVELLRRLVYNVWCTDRVHKLVDQDDAVIGRLGLTMI